MPKCEECGKWFLTQRKLNWHYDAEHYFPRRERSSIVDDNENSIISSGVPVYAHPFYSPSSPDVEEEIKSGGGEFSGGGASGDWGGDSGNDADYSSSDSGSDSGSSDSW